ncbi:hypothetical protein V6N13_117831 [Hibiscus sabdariffa]
MLESIIEEHRASSANPKNVDDVTEDLVDVLLNLQGHGGLEFPLTTDSIKAVVLDMLVAGTEPSSSAAEWAMSEMLRNPRILEKAQAEDGAHGSSEITGMNSLQQNRSFAAMPWKLHAASRI